jgi:hypothetical protein
MEVHLHFRVRDRNPAGAEIGKQGNLHLPRRCGCAVHPSHRGREDIRYQATLPGTPCRTRSERAEKVPDPLHQATRDQ